MGFSFSFDYNSFFELRDPLQASPLRLRSRLPASALPLWVEPGQEVKGTYANHLVVQFDAAQGEIAVDVLWAQVVGPACFSGRIIRLLEKYEVSGWSTYPVEVFDREGELLADYHGLVVTGAVCDADYSRSAVITKPPPALHGKSYDVYRGLFFDEGQWDGSDMFWVDGVRVVAEKVKKVLQQNGIENVAFTPLREREIRVRHVRRN